MEGFVDLPYALYISLRVFKNYWKYWEFPVVGTLHFDCSEPHPCWRIKILWVEWPGQTNKKLNTAGNESCLKWDICILKTVIYSYWFFLVWILNKAVVQFLSHVWLFAIPWCPMWHATFPCPSLSPGVCSYWCPLNQWCHPTISPSVTPFSSCLQFLPASGSFLMSQLFISDGQSIGTSAPILPMNIQGWFPLGLTDLISLLSKESSLAPQFKSISS